MKVNVIPHASLFVGSGRQGFSRRWIDIFTQGKEYLFAGQAIQSKPLGQFAPHMTVHLLIINVIISFGKGLTKIRFGVGSVAGLNHPDHGSSLP